MDRNNMENTGDIRHDCADINVNKKSERHIGNNDTLCVRRESDDDVDSNNRASVDVDSIAICEVTKDNGAICNVISKKTMLYDTDMDFIVKLYDNAVYFESELSYFPYEYYEAWNQDRLIMLVRDLQRFFGNLNDVLCEKLPHGNKKP
jgi:hypothetical protein